jgi:uncharacterized tellurite resistance protein B-like protein
MRKIEKLNELHDSFATVLWSIIISDEVVSKKERKEFNAFFKKEFALSPAEIDVLFNKVEKSKERLEKHLDLLKKAFQAYPTQKAHFMQCLNRCIICDGVDNREYRTFEEIRKQLF